MLLEVWAQGTNVLELHEDSYILDGVRVMLRSGRIHLGPRSNLRDYVQVNTVTKSASALPATPPYTAFYAPIVENDYIDARKQQTTTFSIDVDGASYANVRRFLTSNLVPPPDAVRIEEMVNYFTYRYPQPADGRPVAISSEVAACPWAPEHRLLRVGLQARTVEQWKLAPNNLVFLLDVSGSMSPPDRLPLVKSALRLLVDHTDLSADSLQPVLHSGHVTVQSYRKLRWGGRTGLLLDAA